MRALVAALFAWSVLVNVQGGEAKSRTAPLILQGQEYVTLRDWAEANQFQVIITKKDEEVKLTNRWARLNFKVNSQRAELNNITVFLGYPITLHQGTLCIAQKDVDRCLRPILCPAKNKPKELVKTIALSAGHGGKDSGYQLGSHQEKNYTLLLVREVQKLANRAGLKTVLIRNSDRFVEREERPRLAKRGRADLFLELHYNCAGPGNTESRGVEVYYLTPPGASSTNGGADSYGPLPGNRNDERNILLAYQIHSAMVEGLGLTDRGVRRARFEVLRAAPMPAALIEAGFMSQADEMRRIQDPAYRRQTARAVLDGVLAYKKAVER
jgi:N-acetylmuramoyl-L-alanine amidase